MATRSGHQLACLSVCLVALSVSGSAVLLTPHSVAARMSKSNEEHEIAAAAAAPRYMSTSTWINRHIKRYRSRRARRVVYPTKHETTTRPRDEAASDDAATTRERNERLWQRTRAHATGGPGRQGRLHSLSLPAHLHFEPVIETEVRKLNWTDSFHWNSIV